MVFCLIVVLASMLKIWGNDPGLALDEDTWPRISHRMHLSFSSEKFKLSCLQKQRRSICAPVYGKLFMISLNQCFI